MKRKVIQTVCTLLMGMAVISTFSSNSAGITGHAYTGCGGTGCHNNAQGTPPWGVAGIPPAGYTPGKTYSLTVGTGAPNGTTTTVAVGFDMTVTAGIITAGPGTAANGSIELYSTVPRPYSSGSASWTFTWVAPPASVPGVTFKFTACFSNGNNQADTGDMVQRDGASLHALPSSVSQLSGVNLELFPNPVTSKLLLTGIVDEILHAEAISLNGKRTRLVLQHPGANVHEIDVAELSSGYYQLIIATRLGTCSKSFIKH